MKCYSDNNVKILDKLQYSLFILYKHTENNSDFNYYLISDDTCSCPSHLTGTALAKMCESVTLTFVENIQGIKQCLKELRYET